jgi:hypothetical protein
VKLSPLALQESNRSDLLAHQNKRLFDSRKVFLHFLLDTKKPGDLAATRLDSTPTTGVPQRNLVPREQ